MEAMKRNIDLQIQIGRRFGALVVVGYHDQRRTWKVACDCGETEWTKTTTLRNGKKRCRTCRANQRRREAVKIKPELMDGMETWLKLAIVKRYVEHLRLCRREVIEPAAFRIFVAEYKADASLAMEYNRLDQARAEEAVKRDYRYTSPAKSW